MKLLRGEALTTSHVTRQLNRADQAQVLDKSWPLPAIGLVLFHLPLAFLLPVSGWLGLTHAGLVLLVGIRAALRQQINTLVAVISYIVGAEVLWRMTEANIFWEFGKYATVLLIGLAVLGEKRFHRRHMFNNEKTKVRPGRPLTVLPFFYFIFLLPSVILTLATRDFSAARDEVSFNLSGPLAMMILSSYFWSRPLKQNTLIIALVALISPIVGILTRAVFFTLTQDVTFNLEANFVTSGGYGPNQVSALLGLGALACVILIQSIRGQRGITLFFSLLAGVFLFQAFLTFSRGGVYSFLLATLALGFFLVRSPVGRSRFLFLALTGLIVGTVFIAPSLDQITTQVWQDRFTSLDTTGRLELAAADMQAFLDHPLTGVGVGLSDEYHKLVLGRPVAAHTEISRMLAEHGLLGGASLVLLLILLLNRFWNVPWGLNKALTAAFLIWGLSVMVHSAMRFIAIPYILSLALVAWQIEATPEARGRWSRRT